MSHDLISLTEVVGFLVAIMVLARACDDEGVFRAWGAAVAARSSHSAPRRLALAIALAAAVTTVLSLDATVVLLAPVLLVAARGARRPTALAAVRIANTGSTLLPVSNLTNLLVFAGTGLGFVEFAWLMLPVWLVGVGAEYLVLRFWFRRDLDDDAAIEPVTSLAVPLFPSAVVLVVLLGLATGATPWVPAAAGAVLVGGYALSRRTTTWQDLLEAANLKLAALVLIWCGVVVWLGDTSAGDWVGDLLPAGDSWAQLVGIALVAMVVANAVNNLPATLLLGPAAVAAGPVPALALLIGVNVGANLTGIGSLANLLWHRSGMRATVSWRTFHAVGIVTTPVLVALCTSVLWAWTSLVR